MAHTETRIHMVDPQNAGPHTRVEAQIPLAALNGEDFQKLVDSILVVVVHRSTEGIHRGLCNHFGIWGRIGLRYATLSDPHGGFIEIVRGQAERTFLDLADANPQIRYVVMIDNDQSIEWDHPLKLVMHDKPVVTGVVCGFNPERGVFACFTAKDENGVPRFPSYRFTKAIPETGLKEIWQCGTGLVAIRRDVFETLIDKGQSAFLLDEVLRRESYRIGHIKQGEDFSFCDKVREAGFTIWVDFDVKALHHKVVALGWPEEGVDSDVDVATWAPSSLDFRGLKHLAA